MARIWYCVRNKKSRNTSRLTFIFLELLFPYAITLSALIYDPTGKGASESLWFAAFLCVLILIELFLPQDPREN